MISMNGRCAAVPMAVCAALGGSLLLSCAQVERFLPGTLSNGNVLALLNAIDQIEIDAAKFGQQNAASPNVKAFASHLVQEHTSALEERQHLAEQLKITPKTPKLALALEEQHGKTQQRLAGNTGRDFDKAYIADQISAHERVFQLLRWIEESMDHPGLQRHIRATCRHLKSHEAAAHAAEQ